jgi:type VI protein secretion system component VasF
MVFLLAAAAGSGLFSSHAQSPAQIPASASTASQGHAAVTTPANRPPTASAATTDPKQQIAQLLQMADDLKAAVDKTNKDELSIAVVRKASALEQLAHKVRNAWPASSH